MRITVFLTYLMFQVIYLSLGESTRAWFAFNLITHIGFVAYLCGLLGGNIKSNDPEKQLLSYIQILSIANCFYLVYCVIINDYIRIHKDTDIFAAIYGLGLVVFMFNMANRK